MGKGTGTQRFGRSMGTQRSGGGSAGRAAQRDSWQLLLFLGLLLGLALVLPLAQCHNGEEAGAEAGQGYSDWEAGLETDTPHLDTDDSLDADSEAAEWVSQGEEDMWEQEEGGGSDGYSEDSGFFDSASEEAGEEQYSEEEAHWESHEGSGGNGREQEGEGGQPASAFLSAEEIAEEMELRRDEEERAGGHARSHSHSHSHPGRSHSPSRPARELSSREEPPEDDDGVLFVDDMLGIWVEAMGAALVVSLCSVLCLLLLPLLSRNGKVSRPVVDMLAAFGVGAMLGDAFLHQLPHAFSAHSNAHSHGHGDALAEHSHGGDASSTPGHSHAHSAQDLAVGISVLVGVVAFFLVEKLVRWVEEQAGAEEEEAAAQRVLADKVAQVKRQREAEKDAPSEAGDKDQASAGVGEGGKASLRREKGSATEGEALLGPEGKEGAEATESLEGRRNLGKGNAQGSKRGAAAKEEVKEKEKGEKEGEGEGREEAPDSEDENGWEPLEGPEGAPAANPKGARGAAGKEGKGAATKGGAAGAPSEGAVKAEATGTNAAESQTVEKGGAGAGHGVPPSSSSVVGYLNLFSDAIHNFTDGLSLGAAFLHRGSLGGYSRMLFMLAHEIPQEIGDFGILVRSGMAVLQALALNFVSALMAVAGTAVALSLGADPANSSLVEGFTAGGFIYISLAAVLPDMQAQKPTAGLGLLHTLSLCAGMATALGICMIE